VCNEAGQFGAAHKQWLGSHGIYFRKATVLHCCSAVAQFLCMASSVSIVLEASWSVAVAPNPCGAGEQPQIDLQVVNV